MENKFECVILKVRELFHQPEGFIPLHAPYFGGNEKKYVMDTIESTFVSSVGAYVNRFEELMQEFTGAPFAIATTNGTTALHLALVVAGVKNGDEVITQPLTFVATANAIKHAGAVPIFVDVDKDTMGLSPEALETFLQKNSFINERGICCNKQSGARITACIPMHTFGFPARINEITAICKHYSIILIEDAAESLGSTVEGKHTGRFGALGVFSFNGNKTITSGGGGAIITDDEVLAKKAKHLSTTAKQPHAWEFFHDDVAYNYRMPNLNAALACAQLEQLSEILENKRALSHSYKAFFANRQEQLVTELEGTIANYWLNTIILPSKEERDDFLKYSNEQQVMTRPIWRLINELPMYSGCIKGDLSNAKWLEERIVNLPSSYRPFTK
jgi:aminotransferase in exopolysaccharide biosynthesis